MHRRDHNHFQCGPEHGIIYRRLNNCNLQRISLRRLSNGFERFVTSPALNGVHGFQSDNIRLLLFFSLKKKFLFISLSYLYMSTPSLSSCTPIIYDICCNIFTRSPDLVHKITITNIASIYR